MSGQEIRDLLLDNSIVLADLAKKLGTSPQALNSKLNAKNISVEFVEDISKAINKNVYDLNHKKTTKQINHSEINIEDIIYQKGTCPIESENGADFGDIYPSTWSKLNYKQNQIQYASFKKETIIEFKTVLNYLEKITSSKNKDGDF